MPSGVFANVFGEKPPTILSCEILPPHKGRQIRSYQDSDMAVVVAQMSDGTTDVVLRYFDDELDFTPNEFIGLNKQEAMDLWTQRDQEYLKG